MKIVIKILVGLSIIFLLFSNKNNVKNIKSEPGPLIICFAKDSFHLSQYSKIITDSMITIIKRIKTNNDIKVNTILLIPYGTENEYFNNKYIGVQRSLEIIDYCEKKHDITRGIFKILDKYKFNNGYGGVCSGVEIRLE